MARLKNGINGPYTGSVGQTVGSSWNGIPYIKTKPRKRTSPLSEKEQLTRLHFKLVHEWLQPLLEFVRVGFKGYSPTNYGFNAAKSVLRKNALVKEGFDSWIDPSLAQVSFGSLGISENLAVNLNEDRKLVFSWDTHLGSQMSARDQVMLLAYDPESGEKNYNVSGDFRNRGTDSLNLSGLPSGQYHIYAAFVAQDRGRQSDSVYLGAVEI